jgi:hypothetical protein
MYFHVMLSVLHSCMAMGLWVNDEVVLASFPASNAAYGENVTAANVSSGSNVAAAVDGNINSCTSVVGTNGGSSWLTVDLGYSAQHQAVGVFTGSADIINQFNVRVGNEPSVTGTENPACYTTSNLPGFSKAIFQCGLTGRYVTLEVPGNKVLDVCSLESFLQGTVLMI